MSTSTGSTVSTSSSHFSSFFSTAVARCSVDSESISCFEEEDCKSFSEFPRSADALNEFSSTYSKFLSSMDEVLNNEETPRRVKAGVQESVSVDFFFLIAIFFGFEMYFLIPSVVCALIVPCVSRCNDPTIHL